MSEETVEKDQIETEQLTDLLNLKQIYKNQNQRFWSNALMMFSAGMLAGVLLVKHLKG